jgi:predicted RNA-binding protein YlxR (DUF448 family)
MPLEPVSRARPIRTCVGCRVTSAQDDLLRLHLVPLVPLVADGEGGKGGRRVEPAMIRRERFGRSAYLCPRRACLDQAIKRRAFTRAFSSRSSSSSSSSPGTPGVEQLDSSAADALWACATAQVRREIEQLPHAQPRRRGLERLLSELLSAPVSDLASAPASAPVPVRPLPLERRPRSNGQGGTRTHG